MVKDGVKYDEAIKQKTICYIVDDMFSYSVYDATEVQDT